MNQRVFALAGTGARVAYARRAGQGPGYWLLDARVRAGWRGAELTLDGRNLEGYLDVSQMPAPGRALYVGISWTGER